MPTPDVLGDPGAFSEILYEKMKAIAPGIDDLELYEFRYALHNLHPDNASWSSVQLEAVPSVEEQINDSRFYTSIQIKPRIGERIVLDEQIVRLTKMLFVGLVTGQYPEGWIREHFYFDIRGFYFLHRTRYFTAAVLAHLGGKPYRSFERKQERLERCQSIGYKEFREANAEVDGAFIACVEKLIAIRGTPTILALAGPTAAGKTEIVARLREAFAQAGRSVTSIEMDNFLTDRDRREQLGIYTLGKAAIHLALFQRSLHDIVRGLKITIPRYDFVDATSSHDLAGNLKPGCRPIEIEPADIIFMEGNFPFLLDEVADLIGIKVVYLTDDDIRLKRKWRRDIDYRKKYDPSYLRNRFFREQFLMAQACYIPQMTLCDMVADTTGASLWATPAIAEALATSDRRGER